MTERIDTGSGLIRLSDSEFILEDRAHDIREQERQVRFLDVGAGGFLGLGEKTFLIPVEAVREVNE